MSKSFNLKAIISAVDKVSGPMGRINGSIGSVGRAMRGLKLPAVVIATTAMAAVGKMVSEYVALGSAINDTSERIGVSREQLQELQYVAGQNGVSAESLAGSMEKLNKTIFAASSGKNKEAGGLFKKLGISLKDANGHMRNAADLMPEISDAFAKNADPVLRTAMATTLMGKSGGELIPMLNGGSAAMREQIAEARKLNLILSDKSIRAADELGDKWGKLKKKSSILSIGLAADMAPALNTVADAMLRLMSSGGLMSFFSPEMQKSLSGLGETFSGVGQAIKDLWDSIMPILAPLFELLGGAVMQSVIAQWKILAAVFKGIVDLISISAGGLTQLAAVLMPGNADLQSSAAQARERNSKIVQSYRNTNQVSGAVDVNFNNAPAGMRVAQPVTSPGLTMNPNVGYNWSATGN